MARASSPYRHLLGLAPDEACHAAHCYQRPGGLLHRRFTLTRSRGRSVLCCAISQVTLGGRYPPSCSAEPGSSSADPNEDHGRGHQEVSSRQLYIRRGERLSEAIPTRRDGAFPDCALSSRRPTRNGVDAPDDRALAFYGLRDDRVPKPHPRIRPADRPRQSPVEPTHDPRLCVRAPSASRDAPSYDLRKSALPIRRIPRRPTAALQSTVRRPERPYPPRILCRVNDRATRWTNEVPHPIAATPIPGRLPYHRQYRPVHTEQCQHSAAAHYLVSRRLPQTAVLQSSHDRYRHRALTTQTM
ncbi:hypothetical protein G1C97_0596 [Bifidobacterium sp. DSM 109959]|uniref:Uncharacterized protein n=1 Tax=Bifidobacterium olomucense TaxID=2675324 RepID=A0A7Y0EWF7_9BIFI|nr:hypothetical protein [Bifidobacterium sp. DSM 109959]